MDKDHRGRNKAVDEFLRLFIVVGDRDGKRNLNKLLKKLVSEGPNLCVIWPPSDARTGRELDGESR